ncbi:Prolactin-releasing peptide [Platysternon megacephalum]|uniref:Prolactin-releasing peptide n=1 Tax=Platysternon megacephalum TaxID=55544 RepID=A0A4D9E4J4_9SAUR|nr:Prolactin-releasing peptide [Platysternon megacephalum]
MWHAVAGSHRSHCSPQPKHLKLITVYMLVLLVSLSFTSGQRRSFNHQIDNRSPEIDPFWYVGRGVRPIGRFGKRQLRSSHKSPRPGISSLELIVNALQDQEVLDAEDDGWW